MPESVLELKDSCLKLENSPLFVKFLLADISSFSPLTVIRIIVLILVKRSYSGGQYLYEWTH